MHKVYLIGCGGVGSWLLPMLVRVSETVGHKIVLFDGDVFEPKNLDRQLFDPSFLLRNKAEALASAYPGVDYVAQYLSDGWLDPTQVDPEDWIIVAADNNAARKVALAVADDCGCSVIIAANEYTDAEAYVYYPGWRDTKADPRVYYPNILTDNSDNPITQGAGCVEAMSASPQLVNANVTAAAFAANLYWFHASPTGGAIETELDYRPVHFKSNQYKTTTLNFSQITQ